MKIICDWENCNEVGSYSAFEKDNSKNTGYFVWTHKIFNKNGTIFLYDNQEIEYFIKSDITWHKQTKSFILLKIFLIFSGIMLWRIN